MRMTGHDALMFALYLVVIATGAVIAGHDPLLGFTQIFIGSLFFGLRLNRLGKP